jgi:hydroxyacylglutathione hydrolase
VLGIIVSYAKFYKTITNILLKNKLKNTQLQFKQVPAFQDNYLWVIVQNNTAWVVDPGDANPIIQLFEENNINLKGILITHHHNDHIGGVKQLIDWSNQHSSDKVSVVGPDHPNIVGLANVVKDGDKVELYQGIDVNVIAVPGHTLTHLAYFLPTSSDVITPRIYCGDTLFSSGCGRLFEGTAAQMYQSLKKIAALPDETLVCCAHEYTLSNIRFAQSIEKTNTHLNDWAEKANHLRINGKPTVPTTIGFEKKVNPFMRCDEIEIRNVAKQNFGLDIDSGEETLAIIRKMKDDFK